MVLKSVYGSKLIRSAAAFFLLGAMLLPAVHAARAEADEPVELTALCDFTLPERLADFEPRLTDVRYNSRISFSKDEALEITLADGARGLYIAWHTAPEAATVYALDAAGSVLETTSANPDLLNDYYVLPEGCARVRIAGTKGFAISEVRLYDAQTPPETLCIMQAQQARPKVMLVAAHTADESYYFGSLLPYLSGGDAALVFLSSENRQAQQEAIEARYALGSRTQPIFGSFPFYRSAIDLKRLYTYVEKADVNEWLIRLFRRYQPDTVVTHAAAAEDDIGMHQLASTHVLLAASLAADESKEYVSEREYGVWQMRAVYQHLDLGTSPLYDTQAPLDGFGGESAVSLAQAGFDRYTSLQIYRAAVSDTPYFVQTYPQEASQAQSASELLALLSSLEGPAALPNAAITPAPTNTPEPEQTSAPASEQAQEASDSESATLAPATIRHIGGGLLLLGAVCAAGAFWMYRREKDARKRRLSLVGVAAGALLLLGGAAVLLFGGRAAAQTDPALASTPSPTPTPAPTASPEPSATPDEAEAADDAAFASHFRQEGDPEEVVVFDDENGIYEYRSDTLAVEIRRIIRTEGKPLAYYVAHIYEREVDSYRTGFGSVRINGRDTTDACVMARRYRAVLGMTGDNLLHSDYNRGMMLRDGRIFRSQTAVSMMALTEDFSMRIYFANDTAMLNEIDEGTQDTFAFGPPLVIDGVACENVDQDRVGRINPRAGLGLVEPGHFVAIVVDGRLPYYSHGVLLSDFAQMFLDEGCVMAYNLDGGASATMVFMGEYINKRAENHYRSVPDQLLWGYSELVPGEDEPYQLQGTVPQSWTKD